MWRNLKSDLEWREIAATREAGKANAAFLDHWLFAKKRIRNVTVGSLTYNYGMIKLMQRSGMNRQAIRQKQETVRRCLINTVYYFKYSENGFITSAI